MSDLNSQNIEENVDNKKRVSFSQYSIYLKCPHHWELDYVKNLKVRESTIHTTFGTAIHQVLQDYLVKTFNEGYVNTTNKSLAELAFDEFVKKFEEEYKNVPEQNLDEFNSFVFDGKLILNEIFHPVNLAKYFSPDEFELLGVELPLDTSMINNVKFIGYIDIVLKYKKSNRIKIIDIKTSNIGWTKYMKEDISKYSQLLLYKHIYSKIYNIPKKDIDIEFFIVKRTIDNYDRMKGFGSRIQIFVPDANINKEKEAINGFVDFLLEGFNSDGSYTTKELRKNPGNNNSNCRFCPHYNTNCKLTID